MCTGAATRPGRPPWTARQRGLPMRCGASSVPCALALLLMMAVQSMFAGCLFNRTVEVLGYGHECVHISVTAYLRLTFYYKAVVEAMCCTGNTGICTCSSAAATCRGLRHRGRGSGAYTSPALLPLCLLATGCEPPVHTRVNDETNTSLKPTCCRVTWRSWSAGNTELVRLPAPGGSEQVQLRCAAAGGRAGRRLWRLRPRHRPSALP